jgi:hypothetical protein
MSLAYDNNTYEVIFRVLCDIRPEETADAVYLFAQTEDNELSVLRAAKIILAASMANRILVLKTPPGGGYPGFSNWKNKLINSGVHKDQILSVELEQDALHNTLTEAEATVRYAKRNNFKSLFICAPPFHQVRAFMTTVRIARLEYPELRLYSYPGETLPWHEKVVHSQGRLIDQRSKFIESEMLRIEKYYHKGDLISYDEVLDYLNNRDRALA